MPAAPMASWGTSKKVRRSNEFPLGDSCPSFHSMWGTRVLKRWTRRLETDLTDVLWSLGQQEPEEQPRACPDLFCVVVQG